MDLYVEKTHKKMREMGFSKKMLRKDQNGQRIFFRFETGKITDEQFRDGLRSLLGKDIPDIRIDDAWNAMIGGFQKEKIDIITSLQPDYRTFLLSNTNSMHQPVFENILKDLHGIRMDELFEKVYYSHKLGLGKPDPEIFKFVLKDNTLEARETLYLDDTQKHLDSAKKLGIRTFFFPLNGDLDLLLNYLEELNED